MLRMTERIQYDLAKCPKELVPVLTALVERYAWLLPDWCSELHVTFDDTEEKGGIARTNVYYQYRNVFMHFYPGLFQEADRSRRLCVAHEYCHALNAPLADFAYDSLKQVVKDETLLQVLKDAYTKQNEAVVSDMANVIIEMEDQLAAQLGAANVEYNLLLMTRHIEEVKREKRAVEIEPTAPAENFGRVPSKKAKQGVEQLHPQVVKHRTIERAVREVSAERKNKGKKGGTKKR